MLPLDHSFCWLGHCKMSFFYLTSHELSRGVVVLHVKLLYDLFDGLTILSSNGGVSTDHLLCAS